MDPQDVVKDAAEAMLQMKDDLQYPVNAQNHVMFVNYLHPDLMPGLVYHLVRCGWRKHPDRALIKPRPVVGSQFDGLVAWVPPDEPDEPIQASQPDPEPLWSTRPVVNIIDEKRPE
jgi:hypothetical protein